MNNWVFKIKTNLTYTKDVIELIESAFEQRGLKIIIEEILEK